MWLFLELMLTFIALILLAPLIEYWSLRAGLWMHGVAGKEADRIIRFKRTGKLEE